MRSSASSSALAFRDGLGSVKIQSQVIKLLRPSHSEHELAIMFAQKAVVTLGEEIASQISLSPNWWSACCGSLEEVKIFVHTCWLKTVAGAWTTTHRMSESILWNCIFGCQGCEDTLVHYLTCPVLWRLACEIFDGEESIRISDRLCLCQPSSIKLLRLTTCHGIYHSCKNDHLCVVNGHPAAASIVQGRGAEFARAYKHLVR